MRGSVVGSPSGIGTASGCSKIASHLLFTITSVTVNLSSQSIEMSTQHCTCSITLVCVCTIWYCSEILLREGARDLEDINVVEEVI